jgi:hypothetical protein
MPGGQYGVAVSVEDTVAGRLSLVGPKDKLRMVLVEPRNPFTE